MNSSAEVIVVGAGLNGASTAYFLRQVGVPRVTLIGSGTGLNGASGLAAGLLRVHYDNEPETQLAALSMPYFAAWSDIIGGDCSWRKTGFLRFVEESELDKMRANVAYEIDAGAKAEILSPDSLRREFPFVDAAGVGAAVYEPDTGTASNARCTSTMLAACVRAGVNVQLGATVTSLSLDSNGVAGVWTGDEFCASRAVVLAAGGYSAVLAATIGLKLPLVSKGLTMAEVDVPPALGGLPSYMDPVTDSWFAPSGEGLAIVSVGDKTNGTIVEPGAAPLSPDVSAGHVGLRKVGKRIPGLAGTRVRRVSNRADSFSPDSKPIVGGVDGIVGLYLNVASSGKGHKVAPAIGVALSELIAYGRPKDVELAPFGLDRFTKGGFPKSGSEYTKRAIG